MAIPTKNLLSPLPSADGFFPSFLSFFLPLLSFVSLPLTRTALRNAAGDVSSEKENHSLSEAPDTLRTGENVSGKELVSGNMNLNHQADNFYSCNSKN